MLKPRLSPFATPKATVPFVDMRLMHHPIADELEDTWRQVFKAQSFVGGEFVEAFELEWAAYCGVRAAVGVGNGTDALTLTLRALGIGPGDEVIVPANTFVATAEAVVLTGATPRFADVDPDTLLITADDVADAITPRTAAVIPVHLYGNLVDMPAICAVAKRAGIAVIEDAAQAHGATASGPRAGSFGDAACFSFYPAKNLGALGDGGAVVSNDPALIERIRCLSDHGRSSTERYVHEEIGTNSRLDAFQAAVLSVKLRHLDEWNASRNQAAAAYRRHLPEAFRPVVPRAGTEGAYHLFVVRTNDRDGVREALSARGIETGVHYPTPVHMQGPYRHHANRDFPICEVAATQILSLPMYPYIRGEQIEHVCDVLGAASDPSRVEQIA